MKVKREDTSDLQLLIETLQINPELISVDVIKGDRHQEINNDEDQVHVEQNEGNEIREDQIALAETKSDDHSEIPSISNQIRENIPKTSPPIGALQSLSKVDVAEIPQNNYSAEKDTSKFSSSAPVHERKRKVSEETQSNKGSDGQCSNAKISKVSYVE